MTTSAPVLDLVGDIGHFALFGYAGDVWVAYARQTGALELHKSGDPIEKYLSIDVAYPKKQVSVTMLGDELCIAWSESNTEEVYFSKWHMARGGYTQAPVALWPGISPALARYKDGWLVMSYRDDMDRHVYRVSLDGGTTWSPEPTVADANPIVEVDVSVYPASESRVFWAETD